MSLLTELWPSFGRHYKHAAPLGLTNQSSPPLKGEGITSLRRYRPVKAARRHRQGHVLKLELAAAIGCACSQIRPGAQRGRALNSISHSRAALALKYDVPSDPRREDMQDRGILRL